MRVIVCGGGTGGHVYPALEIVRALQDAMSEAGKVPAMGLTDLLWVGSEGGLEKEIVERAGVAFVGLPAGGLRGMPVLQALRNGFKIAGSVVQALRLLARFRPDAVLATGGYVSVALTVAAWLRRIPVLVYLPDIVPGLAVRLLGHIAATVAVTSEDSMPFFRHRKVVVTGYPVRREIYQADRAKAQVALDLSPAEPTLLVLGGSRGARSINQSVTAGIEQLLSVCQVLHISGASDADAVARTTARLPGHFRSRYHPYAYLHEMASALAASDLVVARAGAATMGELPAAALPAILVPYPYSGQHQVPNANYLVRHGAARMLSDDQLPTGLVPTILALLDDSDALARMRTAARGLARPGAAAAIAELLRALAERRGVPTAGVGP